jgi:hypothetical protein
LCTFSVCIVLPLFIFDAQLLFDYGVLYKHHICDNKLTLESKQIQRAFNFPIDSSKLSNKTPIGYYTQFFQTQPAQPIKCGVCVLWNILDTFVYAIIPFIIILTSSIIIIAKICERRRSTAMVGGTCHTNRRVLSSQDNLSILLITINCLFLIMTGPFNICLIIQSILKYFFSKQLATKFLLQLNDYLRLLQNSYHALSFIFYCVIGNKFRQSACSICRKIYWKLVKCIFGREKAESMIILRCLDHKQAPSNGPTASTCSNDNIKRISYSSSKNIIKKQTCVTIVTTEQSRKSSYMCL